MKKNSLNWIGTKLNLHENFSHEIFVDEIKANYSMCMLERKVLYSKHIIMVYIHCGVALTSRVLKAIMKGNEGMSSSLGVVIISIHTVNTPSSSLTS